MFASSSLFVLVYVLAFAGVIKAQVFSAVAYPAAFIAGSLLVAIVLIALTISRPDRAEDEDPIVNKIKPRLR